MRRSTYAHEPAEGVTAADIVAILHGEGDLRRFFERYGEEKLSGRYAASDHRRAPGGSDSCAPDSSSTCCGTRRRPFINTSHPAKRMFQALRIEVEPGELAALERAIPAALEALSVGGRLVVLSYQSLEDRFVKRLFQDATRSSAPAGLPSSCPSTHRSSA